MKMLGKIMLAGCMLSGGQSLFADDNFEFHGYARAGGGWSEKNTRQSCFLLNNIGFLNQFRLGNECGGLYGEFSFVNWMGKPTDDKTKPWFKSVLTIAMQADLLQTWEPTLTSVNPQNKETTSAQYTLSLREIYTQGGNLLPYDGMLWIGKRFYRRTDIHSQDLFVSDTSGGRGFGFEEMKLGGGSLSLAIVQYRTYNKFTFDDIQVEAPLENTFDVRWAKGNYEVHALYGQTGERAADGAQNGRRFYRKMNGQTFLGIYNLGLGKGRNNRTFLQLGRGIYGPRFWTANPFVLFASDSSPARRDATDIDERLNSYSVRLSNQYIANNEDTEYAFVQILQNDNFGGQLIGDGSKADDRQLSLTEFRGSYYTSNTNKLTASFGHIWAGNNTTFTSDGVQQDDQSFSKVTLATEFVPGKGYWSRPAMRFFVSHGFWSQSARGNITAPIGIGTFLPHQRDDLSATTYGFQTEYWW